MSTHCERVLALLSDGKPHSHHELYALYVVAHSRISDLRKRGYRIERWREGDTYWYQLEDSTRSHRRGEPTTPEGDWAMPAGCNADPTSGCGADYQSVGHPRVEANPASEGSLGGAANPGRPSTACDADRSGLDDGHLCLSPGTPPVPVIEAVCDDSGQLVLGGVA